LFVPDHLEPPGVPPVRTPTILFPVPRGPSPIYLPCSISSDFTMMARPLSSSPSNYVSPEVHCPHGAFFSSSPFLSRIFFSVSLDRICSCILPPPRYLCHMQSPRFLILLPPRRLPHPKLFSIIFSDAFLFLPYMRASPIRSPRISRTLKTIFPAFALKTFSFPVCTPVPDAQYRVVCTLIFPPFNDASARPAPPLLASSLGVNPFRRNSSCLPPLIIFLLSSRSLPNSYPLPHSVITNCLFPVEATHDNLYLLFCIISNTIPPPCLIRPLLQMVGPLSPHNSVIEFFHFSEGRTIR